MRSAKNQRRPIFALALQDSFDFVFCTREIAAVQHDFS
jgi:hypothetical protein